VIFGWRGRIILNHSSMAVERDRDLLLCRRQSLTWKLLISNPRLTHPPVLYSPHLQTTYPLAPSVTALSLEAVLADIKEGIRNTRKSCHGVYAQKSYRVTFFFLLVPKMEACPRSLATRYYSIWIAIARTMICTVSGVNRQGIMP
jgi:hypothetical protein